MEALKDPKNDRHVNIPPPNASILTTEVLWESPKGSQHKKEVNCALLENHLLREGRLSNECLLKLISEGVKVFQKENNLLCLSEPLIIVGDIHGQYSDLVQIFSLGGKVGEKRYLFLGDYVDRGSMSVEVMALLLAYKIRHPKSIYMLRGNHECQNMTSNYNFRQECLIKHNQQVYLAFVDLFRTLPVAALINDKYFAIHAGISPELKSVDQIDKINRFAEPPDSGLFWLPY
jgi:serine/threonine-protein phosphatase 2B catalytic subunit